MRMRSPHPPTHTHTNTLQELAGHSLLKDKSRALLDLEDLPIELFPPLFVEAFSSGHTEVLKKMVQAWPFIRLPLGALMRKPQLEMIQIALDGLDMLAAQQDRPRRWKLQVLDLRKVHGNFWRMWSGAVVNACSPEDMKERQTVTAPPETGPTLPLRVSLCFQQRPLNAFLSFLFHIKRILERLGLDFIQQVEVSAYASQEEKDQLMDDITSQFAKMDSLQRLYLDDPDWNNMSMYPNLDQRIHLTLWGIKLTSFSPEPLIIRLENAAATLETLNSQDCGITNSQLQAILPALSCCSQLRVLSFHGNDISMSVLSNLLLHTSRLSQLSLEKYPAPLESYDAQGAIHPGRFLQLYDELMEILRDVREPKDFLFHTKPCHRCGNRFVYYLPSSPCRCWLPA
uniref:PRAME family member 12-like n=1 Tax=Ictidomys tridecemlineatus TaxID=43179 RepID=UPI001A9E904E|nr:PRAME family member 12-like [Ictidomys tridecemlineatus]